MAELEQEELEETINNLEEELKLLLIPKHPDDHKNAIMEIRPAAGGDGGAPFPTPCEN